MIPSTDVTENRKSASEIKFLIDPPRAQEIHDWARAHLGPDPYATEEASDGYRTSSLYFDTRNFDIFHRRGSFGRGKYRIRRYGQGESVFLERKLRTHDLVSKRRVFVGLNEIGRLENPEPGEEWPGYWFHRRLLARELLPVCQISYLRTARIAQTDRGVIRLTLDQDIRAVPAHAIAFDPRQEGLLLSERQWILELKYASPLPVLFKQLIAKFTLTPQAFSKYRLAASSLGCVPAGSAPETIVREEPVVQQAQLYV
jgi:hypothetical protein